MRLGRSSIVASAFALLATASLARAGTIACAEQCGVEAEQAYHACTEEGGSDEECKAAAATTFQTCIETNCSEPPPADCTTKCEEGATSVQNKCLEKCDAGEACSDLCQQAHDDALARCVKDLCGEPDPGCGDDPAKCCEEDCRSFAHGVFGQCIESEGEEAKDECSARAEEAFKTCTVDHCGEEPEVPCEERCAEKAVEAFEQCANDGNSADVCQALMLSVKQECLDHSCTDPEPTCEESCQVAAEQGLQDCIVNGGQESECVAAAEAAREQCVANECTQPDPDCPARCEEAVAKVVAACVEVGFDEEFCKGLGDEALRHCIERRCVGAVEPEPSCRERCADHAQQEFRRCLEAGGSEDDCRATAKTEFGSCTRLHCDPDLDCMTRCERKATRVKRRCLAAGGSEADCDAKAADVLATCQTAHCAPEPPDTCGSDCEAHAGEVEQACLAAGTPPEDCGAAKQGVLDQCTAACGPAPDQTCTETCEDVAQEKHDRVLERTGDDERAIRKAQRTFRRCERSCED